LITYNSQVTNYLVNLGLPVEGILAPIDERQIVINSIESEIQKISVENRQFATYLTRFLSSVAAGLFDGAVTYLWNETIKSLRKMIVNFDLDYFLKVSSELNNRYKNLRTEDDLSQISDFDLLNASQNFKPIIASFGLDWKTTLSTDMKIIYDSMNAKSSCENDAWTQIKKIGKVGFAAGASPEKPTFPIFLI